MYVIGITGGVGAGKSTVLDYMAKRFSAIICKADEVAAKLEQKGQACYEQIVNAFGSTYLKSDGELDRKKLARLVFSDEKALQELNAIVHPMVKLEILEQIEEAQKTDCSMFVLEAALLIDAGYCDICDQIWYVYATEDVRRKRLRESRGYDDRRISEVFASQSADSFFRKNCDFVIDNSKTEDETKKQIDYLGEKFV